MLKWSIILMLKWVYPYEYDTKFLFSLSSSCALSFWKMTSSSYHSKKKKIKGNLLLLHCTRNTSIQLIQFSLHIDSFLRIITMAFLSHFTPMNFSSLECNKVALVFVDKWTNLNIFGSYLNFFFLLFKNTFQFWRVCGSYKFLQASLLKYR